MPEAVIVSTARSPIGRAGKGSLVSIRPDDLAAQMIRAALDKVPALDPTDIEDLLLGCGLPGGEQGNNMARIVAVQLGYDGLPGTTITRYCSSSVQTSRMAFHAIKAGEGDAFISAGVETVSRFAKGTSDHIPDTRNPQFEEAGARTDEYAQGGQDFSKVEIKTNKVTDKFFTLDGQGGTIGVLIGPDGVFMVDTQFAPLSDKIAAAIKQLTPQPIKFVVNTHVHGDHTGGDENFGRMGATIISREELRFRLAHPNPGANGQPGTPTAPVGLPKQTYRNRLTLHRSEERRVGKECRSRWSPYH